MSPSPGASHSPGYGAIYGKWQDMHAAFYPVMKEQSDCTDVLTVSAKNIQTAEINHQPATSVYGQLIPALHIRNASAAAIETCLVVLTRQQINIERGNGLRWIYIIKHNLSLLDRALETRCHHHLCPHLSSLKRRSMHPLRETLGFQQ